MHGVSEMEIRDAKKEERTKEKTSPPSNKK